MREVELEPGERDVSGEGTRRSTSRGADSGGNDSRKELSGGWRTGPGHRGCLMVADLAVCCGELRGCRAVVRSR